MPQRPAATVAAALIAKGMVADTGHHRMYRKTVDGVTTLVTRMSHGSTVISDGLGKLMANQCALQLREFWDMVDCTLSQAAWDALVTQRCQPNGRNPFLGR